MYFIDFFKKVFKLKNIGIIVWMVINLYIIISFFPTTEGVTNGSEALAAIIRGVVVYTISVALALSPIGEAIFRSMNGCREIADSSILNRLTPLFNEIYEKAKLKDPNLSQNIKLYMVDQPYPNAFALGRNTVCVTNGLLHLDDAEIKGIFAHEFAHLSNKDTDIALFIYVGNLLASLMFLILRVILFIISFLMISFSESNSTYETYDAYGRRQRKKGGALKGFVLAAGLDMIYVAIIGLYTKLGIILVSHSSRNHEFAADKFAYNLGYGRKLRDALVELQGETEKPTGFVANLMATHPKTALRIEKLNMYLSGNFDDDLNKSIDEEPQTSNDKTDTADYNTSETDYSSASSNDTASFNKEETKYSVDSSDTMRQPTINGITFIDDDINSDRNINNEQTKKENTLEYQKRENIEQPYKKNNMLIGAILSIFIFFGFMVFLGEIKRRNEIPKEHTLDETSQPRNNDISSIEFDEKTEILSKGYEFAVDENGGVYNVGDFDNYQDAIITKNHSYSSLFIEKIPLHKYNNFIKTGVRSNIFIFKCGTKLRIEKLDNFIYIHVSNDDVVRYQNRENLNSEKHLEENDGCFLDKTQLLYDIKD